MNANHQAFNVVAATVLASCYNEHPLPSQISNNKISTQFNLDENVVENSINWLVDNKYITVRGTTYEYIDANRTNMSIVRHALLSDKGFGSLAIKMDSLSGSVGEVLAEKTREANTPSGASALGEFLGGFFGGSIKTLSS